MRIKLTTRLSTTRDGLYAYALHVEALSEDSNDCDCGIFVFRRSPRTMNPFGPTDSWFDDDFFNVATPVDMYDIPLGQPDLENGMPYYRDSKVDLWFRNKADALRAKTEIEEDVASLVRLWDNINDTDGFEEVEDKVYE